jgi:hypothetical protein
VGFLRKEIGPTTKQVVFFLSVIVFFCSFQFPAVSASQQLFTPGIYLTLPSGREVEAGEVVTYIFRVENQTDETVSFEVEAASSQGWPLLSTTPELTLAPNAEDYLVYSLLTPATVLAGTTDQLRLTLKENGNEQDFIVRTVVKPVRLLQWEPVPLLRAQAGEEIFFPVRLKNLGTTAERLELEIKSENGWPIYYNSINDPVYPGQEGQVLISCYVPEAIPAGTLEEISLRLLDSGPETAELKLKILITQSETAQKDQDLAIPLNSMVSFNYIPPRPNANLPWNLTWKTRGDLSADTHFDLFFNSAYEVPAPTAAYLGVTGDEWALRLGALGHNWDGPVPPPTYSSLLYFQNQRRLPWRLWIGPFTQEGAPLWWGTGLSFKQPDLQFNYLHNLEDDSYFQHSLAGIYQLYASPLYGWKLTTKGILGLGETEPLTQGGIALSHRQEDWELTGEFQQGTDFYNQSAFNEFALTAYVYPPMQPSLTTGFSMRNETPPAAPNLLSSMLWSELIFNNHRLGMAYTLRSDGEIKEIKAGTIRRGLQSSLSFSANYRREDLSSQRQTLILGANYRYRFNADNYLETLLKETFNSGPGQPGNVPELGFRWRYRAANQPWNCFGLIQWDLSAEPVNRISAFQSGFGAQIAPGTSWQVYAQLSFEENNPLYSMIFRLEHNDLYFLPSPWSGIHGKVFVDLNRNGIYDPGEPGLSGLPVLLNGSQATLSKEDGSWEIPFTGTGRQLLDFPPQHQNYYTLQTKKELFTERYKSLSVLVPYLPPTEVRGQLFIDTNRNNTYDPGEKGLSGVMLTVFDRNHQLIMEKSANVDGAFFLSLLPGEYILKLEEESLAVDYLPPEPFVFNVTTASPLLLPVALRPVTKEIEFSSEEIIPPEFWDGYTEESW